MSENETGKKDLRVAMVIQVYYPHIGGAERQLMALAPLLQQKGVTLQVFTRRFAGLPAFEEVDTVPVHRLPAPGPKPIAALAYIFSSIAKIISFKPDVLHAHEMLSPASTATLAKMVLKRPVVIKVLRGGKLGDIDKLRKRPMGAFRISMMRKMADRFISISREINAELQDIGVPQNHIADIPNGVDVQRFQPATATQRIELRKQYGLPKGKLVVFTGRLVPEKRLDLLIRVWPQILQQHPQATLLILGDGAQADELRQAAGEGIQFFGQCDNVQPYLQAADLYVLPSATEGLSNALLEAMATGLPCLATGVGGAPDLIEHGVNGWLIPANDQTALAEALLQALAHPQPQEIGRQARKTIEDNYSLEATASRLVALYRGLCQEYGLN